MRDFRGKSLDASTIHSTLLVHVLHVLSGGLQELSQSFPASIFLTSVVVPMCCNKKV